MRGIAAEPVGISGYTPAMLRLKRPRGSTGLPPEAADAGPSSDPAYVRRLFDEMAATYGLVNLVSSLGFAVLWRRRCVRQVDVRSGWTAVDLMTGMGELCPDIARRIGPAGTIKAIDLSPEMCSRAREHARKLPCVIDVIEGNVLENDLRPSSADVVYSSFGLKTFSHAQLADLAEQIARILKPGGTFSLLEISVPPNSWIRLPYLFYIQHVIPWIGRMMLGNPENYRMLGRYTTTFGSCASMRRACERAGLLARETSHFFGCATGVYGFKPADSATNDVEGQRSRAWQCGQNRLSEKKEPSPRRR